MYGPSGGGTSLKSKLVFFQRLLSFIEKQFAASFAASALHLHPIAQQDCLENMSFCSRWHKAKKAMSDLKELVGENIIAHPAQSPDLNILEDLWSYLDKK